MARRAPGSGFRSLRELGPAGTGLPPRRVRELVLEEAWRRVAGEALARRLGPIRVARGTLQIEAPDRRWAEVLSRSAGRLAGRLAAEAPGAGIRRVRLRVAGDSSPFGEFAAAAVSPGPPRATPRAGEAGAGRPADAPPVFEASAESLERLAERYARAARARGSRRRP